MTSAQQVVQRARQLLREHGWTTGVAVSMRGYCMWGALRATVRLDEDLALFKQAVLALRVLLVVKNLAPVTIPEWNDAPGRTYQEVDAALAELEVMLEPAPVPELACV